jgi:hypothetical protein
MDLAPSHSIELTNGASAMREIYYAGGRKSIFSYPPTRNPLRNAAGCATVNYFLYIMAASNQIGYIVCFVLSLIPTIWFLIRFATNANKYLKWKKGVDDYLRNLHELGNHQLNLTPLTFELINKKETIIKKWSAIDKVTITPELIQLSSGPGVNFQFPAKSMNQANYQFLQDFIRQRINSAEITAYFPSHTLSFSFASIKIPPSILIDRTALRLFTVTTTSRTSCSQTAGV